MEKHAVSLLVNGAGSPMGDPTHHIGHGNGPTDGAGGNTLPHILPHGTMMAPPNGDEHGHGHDAPVSAVEAAAFYGQQPIDAGAEQGLAALRDSPEGAKPFYPYSTLIR
jgi:hypothetical protein